MENNLQIQNGVVATTTRPNVYVDLTESAWYEVIQYLDRLCGKSS